MYSWSAFPLICSPLLESEAGPEGLSVQDAKDYQSPRENHPQILFVLRLGEQLWPSLGLGLETSPNEPLETLQSCSPFNAAVLLDCVFCLPFSILERQTRIREGLGEGSRARRRIRKPRLWVPAWKSCVSLNWLACLQAMGQQCPHLQSAKHNAGAGHRCMLALLRLQALRAHK